MNLTGQTRSSTYPSLLSGSSAAPAAGTRYEITWGNGNATGVFIGNAQVAATGVFLQNTLLLAANGGGGTITFPATNGTVTLNPSSGSYLVRPAAGTFYLGQNNVSLGNNATAAHTITSSASVGRALTIADESGAIMIRPASGNLHLADTATIGGTNRTTITTAATAPRTVTLPDADGTLLTQAPGQTFVSAFSSVLAADFTTTAEYQRATSTGAVIPFPALILQPGLYLITAYLITRSSVAGTAAQYHVRFPGGEHVRIDQAVATEEFDPTEYLADANSVAPSPAYVAGGNVPTQRMYLCRVTTTATLAAQIGWEQNATAATITALAGSTITALKLA